MERDRDWLLPAIVIAAMSALLAALLKTTLNFPGRPSGLVSLEATIAIGTIAGFIRFTRYLYGLWRAGEEHPLACLGPALRPALRGFAPIVAGIGIIGAFLYSITFLKSMIVAAVPFWTDAPLAATDAAMGFSANALARALHPIITELGLFYGLWHVVHLGSIIWLLHWPSSRSKSRLIVGFMLTWAIGMAMAYIFSSAGPIFTGRYDPMLAPESVRRVTTLLWSNYEKGGAILGGGISAFPSMHVALAAWFAIVLQSRGWPRLGLAYLAAIYFCSVVLGWHYVADGAAGIAIALLADRLAGMWIRRAPSQQQMATAAATGASTA